MLGAELPWLDRIERAKAPARLPVGLTRDEVARVLARLTGVHQLIGSLLCGTALHIMEGLRLRVKDVDFGCRAILVRDGKGQKDRITMLLARLDEPLRIRLEHARELHRGDLDAGFGAVWLPHALDQRYPNAATQWACQYVFPAEARSIDSRSGIERRRQLSDRAFQRAMRAAVRTAGVHKRATPLALCHSSATHQLESGCGIRTVQELLGHTDVSTTMVYTHDLDRGGRGVVSPMDATPVQESAPLVVGGSRA